MESTLIKNLKKISSSPESYSSLFVGLIAEEAIEELERLNSLIPEWQPISTAPMDGTHILVPEHCIAYYAPHTKSWQISFLNFQINPTRWMPLPPPPNE